MKPAKNYWLMDRPINPVHYDISNQ